ncbi:FtsX-like permease family protein [Thermomonospora cellulosilytica]|uniref:ABC3 transporter permease C-terminal domain-containing protein n=1 Tax=Thermomonospora cellulosilytica TaxID=1411118 RepID=A0A7W3R657_9ACTN|nr:FtsX-like permease family protein [Thermomonospora cellulosilytica]MBA9001156.1 hypothetical protein [Thermomonospora cellulosilytica]
MSAALTVAAMLARGASHADRRVRRLMIAAAALATFFLLGAGNLLTIRGNTYSDWAGLVTEEGLRGGTALALALLVVPPLALLHQAGRIAQATRERRLAALRLAGATPREVRLIAAAEALRVSVAGAVLGVTGYVVCQQAAMAALSVERTARYAAPVWLVPLVVAAVVAAGAVTGLLASRHVLASPLGVSRRAHRPHPRAVALLPLGAGLVIMAVAAFLPEGPGVTLQFTGGAVTVVGMVAAGSRLVLESARLAARWARTPQTLLAARTLQADPRSWGRTLSVIGLVVLFGTGAGIIQADVLDDALRDDSSTDPFWLVSFTLVDLALLLALAVAAVALVVHRAEWLLESRRSLAALTASGTPVSALRRTAQRQALIAAAPVCAVAALTGLIGMGAFTVLVSEPTTFVAAWSLGRAVLMTLLGIAAASAVTAASRRLLARAASPEQLRTE